MTTNQGNKNYIDSNGNFWTIRRNEFATGRCPHMRFYADDNDGTPVTHYGQSHDDVIFSVEDEADMIRYDDAAIAKAEAARDAKATARLAEIERRTDALLHGLCGY